MSLFKLKTIFRNIFLSSVILVVLIFGIAPILHEITHSQASFKNWGVVVLNCAGWLIIAVGVYVLSGLNKLAQEAIEGFGVRPSSLTVIGKVKELIILILRLRESSQACRVDVGIMQTELGDNLQQVVKLVYQQFPVRAVELSLFDEESGLWSQALLVGEPTIISAQSMLEQASGVPMTKQITLVDIDDSVLIAPLVFAGTLFGALRLEIQKAHCLSSFERELLMDLSTKAALMLINSRFTEEMLRLRKLGEESLKAKTGFLAQLSHEIRGPLGTIINGADLLKDGLCGKITEQQGEMIKMIRQSGEHLLDLVTDVLDYAKVESGKVQPKLVDIPVAALVEDLAKVIRAQAQAKGHQVVVEKIERNLGIRSDKRHVRQILINLLTNAVKYTPNGGMITLSAEWIRPSRVRISVIDTGVGISRSNRSKVFAPFERVDEKYSNTQVGSGLGMSLSKKLAEVNSGTLDFESEQNKGSRFWLELPAAEIQDFRSLESGAQGGVEKIPVGRPTERVLLVESNHAQKEMIERFLRSEQFTVISADSSANVISVLREHSVEIAVIENDMSDLPGEELAALLRSNPRTAAIPLVLLTASAFSFDIERFLKLGVDRCLSKPLDFNEFAATLRWLIDESRL